MQGMGFEPTHSLRDWQFNLCPQASGIDQAIRPLHSIDYMLIFILGNYKRGTPNHSYQKTMFKNRINKPNKREIWLVY